MTDKVSISISEPSHNSGSVESNRVNRRSAGRSPETRDLIRQIIENVAVPELLRRHGDLPPSRKRKAVPRTVPESIISEAVELFVRPDCTAAKDFIAERLEGPKDRPEWLISSVLPHIAARIERCVAEGSLSSAHGVIGLSNLRIVAWEVAQAKPLRGRGRRKPGRIALVSMADDAASFDLIPYEHTFWREGYEVENLEGVSSKLLLDTLHDVAFDVVFMSVKRTSLRPILEKWIRAAKIVGRGAPKFYAVANGDWAMRSLRGSTIDGCSGTVYGARDGLRLVREALEDRVEINGAGQRPTPLAVPPNTARFNGKGTVDFRNSRRAVLFGSENYGRSLARH